MGFGLVTFRVVVMIGMDIAGGCGWWVLVWLWVYVCLWFWFWFISCGFVYLVLWGCGFVLVFVWWYVGGCLAWMAGSVWLFVWWFAELGWCSVWFCFGFGFVCGCYGLGFLSFFGGGVRLCFGL